MKKQSSGTGRRPGANEGHQDDKRGTGRTAAHPQLEDEEDDYASGRRDTGSSRGSDLKDYEGDEDIAERSKHGREDLEDDSEEGAASRQQRSIRSDRDEEEDDEDLPSDPGKDR